ncbi:bacteriocin immunity protein [Lactobacillus sp. CBA3605]|nr:bacteriocin immunity protein [Lactobacillus sp. CBA3605]AVK60958.1 bacteriocin immunity protein [Lactobacillus sp. CBA3605]
MSNETKNRDMAKAYIQVLLTSFKNHEQQPGELLDMIDVLAQVYKKLDKAKDSAALVNRLVNYIRSMAIKGRIHFPAEEEDLMIKLSAIGKKAGLNGLYMADFSDKSQFYGFLEKFPRHS